MSSNIAGHLIIRLESRTSLGCTSRDRQSQEIERLQRRALQYILGDVNYEEAYSTLGLITLVDRCEQKTFFEQLTHPDSCLTHLISPKRDLSIHLRRTRLYELHKT